MSRFDSFILLAGMRTGSNFLESNLNRLPGVTCHGEAFNPSFVGYPKIDSLFGMGLTDREADPFALLARIRAEDGLNGFRYFHDHDPRVLDTCLHDPLCAKIILTRNPVDSFVSWKIAQATGQWKLTNATHAKAAAITFDADAFAAHLAATQAFLGHVQRALQITGQTAFHITYDDLRDLEVLNGLAQFLDVPGRLDGLDRKLKKQNPGPLSDRVANAAEMQAALAGFDRFDLHNPPQLEPRRGPAIPTYVAAPESGLLYVPLRSGPDAAVTAWLAALDGQPATALRQGFTQKSLRDWQDALPVHRSFTVLRHPLARAHAAFCDRILSDGPDSFPELRANLRRIHHLPIPETMPDLTDLKGWSDDDHRAAFAGFLAFLKLNLAGQTGIRVDPSWASQLALLQGIAQFAPPDMIIREDDLVRDLPVLARQVGQQDVPAIGSTAHPHEARLAAIYDAELEALSRAAYARDYASFAIGNWR